MTFTALALVTAGVSIAMGSISFIIGLKKNHTTELIFGLMGLLLFIFFLMPPVGFITADHPPYPVGLLVKRIFIYSYYGLIPWFILHYTGYGKKMIPLFIDGWIVLSYMVMLSTTVDQAKPIWSLFSVVAFGLIFIYGITAGIWQYKNERKTNAKWFLVAMSCFGALFLVATMNQIGLMERLFNFKLFFPMHLHALLFMPIVGLRIVAMVFEREDLERKLKARDRRWQSFMLNAPLVVQELDQDGTILYVNDFGLNLFGYGKPDDLIKRNWFDTFLSREEVEHTKQRFKELIQSGKVVNPYYQRKVFNREGKELLIGWVNFVTYTEDGHVFGVMSIGRDLSEENRTAHVISQLKLELEKEKISFTEEKPLLTHEEIIGTSEAIGYAMRKAHQVAPTNAPVLLEGETGVGKDMLADLIHKMSSRSTMPMVKVNCGALPKDLIEDELFGHEKGAFTSAIQSRRGRFELADGGTIFLDEIGELPFEMQPKLLRVLQSGEFERVGGQKTIRVDVRIIAATNRDLQSEVANGRFRDDLFYRLNVFPITLPPLRKRKEDLPALIHHFVATTAQKYGKVLEHISKADLQRLTDYAWPGNVRELKNVIERAIIISTGSTLRFDWFLNPQESLEPVRSSPPTLEHIEREHIVKVMEECQWKINGENGAAQKLAMHPNTLRSRMKKLGITRPSNQGREVLSRD
jgi:PAS domain S-box-containing protein